MGKPLSRVDQQDSEIGHTGPSGKSDTYSPTDCICFTVFLNLNFPSYAKCD